jgi:hypothetical protein
VIALDVLAEERSEAAERHQLRELALAGADTGHLSKGETRTDDEARSIADRPHLTGDPEWDAIELAATDPSAPPVNPKDWMRG